MGRSVWARRILISLFVAHAIAMAMTFAAPGYQLAGDWPYLALGALNVTAIAGVVTRTKSGWFLAFAFVACAIGRYAFAAPEIGLGGGLLPILAIAAAILCVTDPGLRRDHGIAT